MLKKIIILLMLTFIICSCSMQIEKEWYDIEVPEELKNANAKQIDKWVWNNNNINYKAYSNNVSPQDVMENKEADCKGKVLTAIAIYYQLTGNKGTVLYGYNKDLKGFHVEANYCGQTFYKMNLEIYSITSFEEIKNYL